MLTVSPRFGGQVKEESCRASWVRVPVETWSPGDPAQWRWALGTLRAEVIQQGAAVMGTGGRDLSGAGLVGTGRCPVGQGQVAVACVENM